MRTVDCPETSVTKHQSTYPLRRAKISTLLALSNSVIFRILFIIPYHLVLEMNVKNIVKQLKDNTFFSVSTTRKKFTLLFNADY
jgi:hypothetical protein